MGQAALSGNINAVGLLELLRIPMTTKRTGTLIVICEDADASDVEARFQYANGTLVGATLGDSAGEEALRRMLAWREGEFEFLADTQHEGPIDERLHPVVLAELRSWYASRAGVSAASSSTSGSRPATTPRAVAPARAVANVNTPPRAAQPAPAASPAPAPVASPAPSAPTPASSALGSAKLDARGNVREVVGQLSPKEGALAFASLQIGATIGKDLGVGNPHSIEVRGKRDRWLGAAVRGEVAVVVACPPDTDLTEELGRR